VSERKVMHLRSIYN